MPDLRISIDGLRQEGGDPPQTPPSLSSDWRRSTPSDWATVDTQASDSERHPRDKRRMTSLFNFRRILIPLDGSETAELAVPIAVELAQRLSLPVYLVRVVDGADLP